MTHEKKQPRILLIPLNLLFKSVAIRGVFIFEAEVRKAFDDGAKSNVRQLGDSRQAFP
jgi:hypothetical protein